MHSKLSAERDLSGAGSRMSSLLRLVTLPLRAPMLLVLLAVSIYEGLRWTGPTPTPDAGLLGLPMVMLSLIHI